MPEKSSKNDYGGKDNRIPMEEAEERINAWKKTEEFNILDLANLGLKEFPESLRTLQNIEYIFF